LHMIIDADDNCHDVNIQVGALTSVSRTWDITVTQYTCGDYDSPGGPPGCMQFSTGTTGRISSYGWDRSVTTILATSKCLYEYIIMYYFASCIIYKICHFVITWVCFNLTF
jgi:hypothetical protein